MTPSSLLPTTELVERLALAERDCLEAWVRAMAEQPGNPLRAAVRSFGRATALVCGRIPAQVFNRVFGMTAADQEQIPAIVQFYREHGATPLFDFNPYAIPQVWTGPAVLQALARHGFYQSAFHQLLYALPTMDLPATPACLTIGEIGPADADRFAAVYETVWGDPAPILVLIGHPEFRCYLAYVEGEAAALGVLHLADGVGSMANALTMPSMRGRGCQTALLHRRIRDAALAGCDLLASQCSPGTASQRNQIRAGFLIAGTKVWWVPVEAG
jgi:GNAT superfamily N-acetyltransferase